MNTFAQWALCAFAVALALVFAPGLVFAVLDWFLNVALGAAIAFAVPAVFVAVAMLCSRLKRSRGPQ